MRKQLLGVSSIIGAIAGVATLYQLRDSTTMPFGLTQLEATMAVTISIAVVVLALPSVYLGDWFRKRVRTKAQRFHDLAPRICSVRNALRQIDLEDGDLESMEAEPAAEMELILLEEKLTELRIPCPADDDLDEMDEGLVDGWIGFLAQLRVLAVNSEYKKAQGLWDEWMAGDEGPDTFSE